MLSLCRAGVRRHGACRSLGMRFIMDDRPEYNPKLAREETRNRYIGLCGEVIEVARRELPETYAYRGDIEKLYRFRKQVAEEEKELGGIESRVEAGDMDELIWAAEDEIAMIPQLAEGKPWELVDDTFDLEICQRNDSKFVPFQRNIYVE